MQKFPLRMKDNDLLVTELYRDPNHDPVTAISVYLTPKTSRYFVFFLLVTIYVKHFFFILCLLHVFPPWCILILSSLFKVFNLESLVEYIIDLGFSEQKHKLW